MAGGLDMLKRVVFFTLQENDDGEYTLCKKDGFSYMFKDITLNIHEGSSREKICVTDGNSGILLRVFDVFDSEVRGFESKAKVVVEQLYLLKNFHSSIKTFHKTEYYKNVSKAYKCLLDARKYMRDAKKDLKGGNL